MPPCDTENVSKGWVPFSPPTLDITKASILRWPIFLAKVEVDAALSTLVSKPAGDVFVQIDFQPCLHSWGHHSVGPLKRMCLQDTEGAEEARRGFM